MTAVDPVLAAKAEAAQRIAEISARADAATPPELWEAELDDDTDDDGNRSYSALMLYVGGSDWFAAKSEQEVADVEFAAHALADVRWLLSERATREEAVAEFVAFCQTTPYSVTQVAEQVVDFMRAGITGSTLAAVLAPASYRPKDKQ